jgi:sugar-specific transcriptional regulator TrmB
MTTRNENVAEKLLSFGLSKKEAGVYLAALELGHGTVSQISRKASINRTTGYDILDSLSNYGLVRISGKEPKQEYVAESPDNLITMLEKRLEDTKTAIENAKESLPEFKSIHTVSDRPQVRFYEGIEGMKHVYEDTLTSSEPIRAYGNYDVMYGTMGDYFPAYYRRRAKKGIKALAIVPDSQLARERASKDTEEMRELAIVPKQKFDITPDIEIYDNKVMITSWKEKLGIIIESAEVADAMKKIFELAWVEAKRQDAELARGEKGDGRV